MPKIYSDKIVPGAGLNEIIRPAIRNLVLGFAIISGGEHLTPSGLKSDGKKMNELVQRFLAEAGKALQKRKYIDACRCYEKAADIARHSTQAAELLKKASETFRKSGRYEEADRCWNSIRNVTEKAKGL